MARKSRIAPIREYLESARIMAEKEQDLSATSERYRDAEIYKSFKEVLIRAIELCEEPKQKGRENNGK